jgi:hypothetical protein
MDSSLKIQYVNDADELQNSQGMGRGLSGMAKYGHAHSSVNGKLYRDHMQDISRLKHTLEI